MRTAEPFNSYRFNVANSLHICYDNEQKYPASLSQSDRLISSEPFQTSAFSVGLNIGTEVGIGLRILWCINVLIPRTVMDVVTS